MIYTSYFANLKKLPKNLVPISICGKAPDWYKGLQYKKLAPKYDFFIIWKENHDNDYYIENLTFRKNKNPSEIEKELKTLAKRRTSNKIILLCYEKPGDFCHRHLVADWLTKHGIPCEEYE